MDTAEVVLQVAQLVVALAGLIGLVVTIQQRTNSDNRSEWWKRYTWSIENIANDNERVRSAAWQNTKALYQSSLITKTEKALIAGLALETLNDDNQEQDDTGGSDAPRNQSSSTPNDC
ncbi:MULTISPECIES: hypothetical protein [Corynebacterium]|uniref:Uncharacterized protein n=1 Tax=Corynebacterium pseudodiphtheriticum TaxID=37637 RepID=A0ABT7FYW1_9CORY|nr:MULTISPECIES: hypothetical protein [Corynebacterium]MDC7087917.1 hypothetical protein [Corynebacterium pseudodiphtheriticum]MDK4291011.1 hypothetical protein [Corynebacterium pseudodiphtheriticum]MDK4321242.1 hypothetical protein [Corynebacterium pseudodiphtheriticum]